MTAIVNNSYNLLNAPFRPDLCRHTCILHFATLCLDIGTDQHRRLIHHLTHLNNATVIQLRIIDPNPQRGPARDLHRVSNPCLCLRLLVIFFTELVGPVTCATEHAALKRIRVHDNAVILVVASKGTHRQNQIVTIGHRAIRQIVIIQSPHNRGLRITKDVRLIIKAIHEVRRIDRNTLLRLRAAELITRRLIVIRIRNHTCHEAHNRAWVDFKMACLRLNMLGKVRNIRFVRLIWIH